MMKLINTLDDIEQELSALLRLDPRLVPVAHIARAIPLRRSAPGFDSLASIIVSQQVSRASAEAITFRLGSIGALGQPQAFLSLDDDALLGAGLSRIKLRTLRLVAQAVISGALDLNAVCTLNADLAIAQMTAISGIGPWTAEVYLLFCAGHPDIFPSADIALQSAMQSIFCLPERPSAKQTALRAKDWSPHRGTASRLLWAYYGAMRGGVIKSAT